MKDKPRNHYCASATLDQLADDAGFCDIYEASEGNHCGARCGTCPSRQPQLREALEERTADALTLFVALRDLLAHPMGEPERAKAKVALGSVSGP